MNFDHYRTLPIFKNSIADWLIALSILLGVILVLLTLRRIVRSQHARMLATPEVELMEVPLGVLSRTTALFFVILAVYLALNTLTIGSDTQQVLTSMITIAIFWQTGVWIAAAVSVWLTRKRAVTGTDNLAAVSSLGIIGFCAQALIWSIVLLLTLENLGVKVTTLVAGLGVGGIAVALAVQSVLGDLLASLSITLDRPFVIGDFLAIDDVLGSVEYIGVKSTRLRSLSGEQIVMSNTYLLKGCLHNYGRMTERRVLFALSITYETSPELVEAIPAMIRGIVESQKPVRFDRCHFAKYSASSLDYEIVYFVLSPDYNLYMDIQQTINQRIFRKFAELKIEFAYPTQKLFVTQVKGDNALVEK